MSGHPITALAAIIDGFPSVASYYSLCGRFHYSFPVKHGGSAFSLNDIKSCSLLLFFSGRGAYIVAKAVSTLIVVERLLVQAQAVCFYDLIP